MSEEDRWAKLEEIVRRVVKEEIAALAKNGKTKIECVNGRWVGVTEDQMQAWRDAYPAVDIDAELKRMAAWIVSNPMMAPKSQVGRFVNTWLTKSQNQASLRSIPTERRTETPMKLCVYCDAVASGQTNGKWACGAHFQKALDGDPIPRMRGVEAKPVAGA